MPLPLIHHRIVLVYLWRVRFCVGLIVPRRVHSIIHSIILFPLCFCLFLLCSNHNIIIEPEMNKILDGGWIIEGERERGATAVNS
mmetsp:Transcript_15115/g.17522  ORF Transcript_15115/g.17522 Transcript_15115/m.17522 type:complete len:85 (+) Transcript_15115:428-682(+)